MRYSTRTIIHQNSEISHETLYIPKWLSSSQICPGPCTGWTSCAAFLKVASAALASVSWGHGSFWQKKYRFVVDMFFFPEDQLEWWPTLNFTAKTTCRLPLKRIDNGKMILGLSSIMEIMMCHDHPWPWHGWHISRTNVLHRPCSKNWWFLAVLNRSYLYLPESTATCYCNLTYTARAQGRPIIDCLRVAF